MQPEPNISIHQAAASNNLKTLKFLLHQGVGINSVNKKGQTALHIAIKGGYYQICEALLEKDINIYATDNQGNTAMHTAVLCNQIEGLRILYQTAQLHLHHLCSNDDAISDFGVYQDVCDHLFGEIPCKKLSSADTVRFEKIWLYDAYLALEKILTNKYIRKVPPSNKDVIDYVLKTLDPRPETGVYVSNPLYNPLKPDDIMTFIPTISNSSDLASLIHQCIRMCALDVINRLWRRTPLHMACDANTIDSHKNVIFFLLNECGCNSLLRDKNNKLPMDLLIQEKMNLLNAPSAARLTEEFISSRRDEYFDRVVTDSCSSHVYLQEQRRNQVLADCIRLASQETFLLWDARRNAAITLHTYVTWYKLMDIETSNLFYMQCVASEEEGVRFENFNWSIPLEAAEINKTHSLIFWCAYNCVFLRQLDRWDMLRCKITDVTFYLHLDTLNVSFSTPKEFDWSALLKDAELIERLGYFQEWTSMKDRFGNVFYYNAIMNLMTWDRPPDAQDTSLQDQLCSAFYVSHLNFLR